LYGWSTPPPLVYPLSKYSGEHFGSAAPLAPVWGIEVGRRRSLQQATLEFAKSNNIVTCKWTSHVRRESASTHALQVQVTSASSPHFATLAPRYRVRHPGGAERSMRRRGERVESGSVDCLGLERSAPRTLRSSPAAPGRACCSFLPPLDTAVARARLRALARLNGGPADLAPRGVLTRVS
jgi:hypothetical protein